MIERVEKLLSRVTLSIFGQQMTYRILRDQNNPSADARVFIQIEYAAPCTKTGEIENWRGGKHYLSEHMTDDEIIKKAYVAFEMAVKHEVMEGFKVDGTILFNPHVNFEELLKISHKEVKRQ